MIAVRGDSFKDVCAGKCERQTGEAAERREWWIREEKRLEQGVFVPFSWRWRLKGKQVQLEEGDGSGEEAAGIDRKWGRVWTVVK